MRRGLFIPGFCTEDKVLELNASFASIQVYKCFEKAQKERRSIPSTIHCWRLNAIAFVPHFSEQFPIAAKFTVKIFAYFLLLDFQFLICHASCAGFANKIYRKQYSFLSILSNCFIHLELESEAFIYLDQIDNSIPTAYAMSYMYNQTYEQ